jgi:hypothetical protein
MVTRLHTLAARLWLLAHDRIKDERGSTTENVIWIAGLAAIAIGVIVFLGPAIMDAVHKIKFSAP